MPVRIGIDTGGTFTDLIGLDESTGEIFVAKTPSTPRDPVRAVAQSLDVSGVALDSIRFVILGTTTATNALLQRKGADVIFLTTEGFQDIPYIQRMNRRFHYSLKWTKPRPLVKHRDCLGVAERLDFRGDVRIALDDTALENVAAAVQQRLEHRDGSPVALAVCLLFAYVNPEHELRLADFLRQRFPELPVSLSHQVAPIWREYERGSTVIADAYIKPTSQSYVASVHRHFQELGLTAPWAVMKSNGGNAIPEAAQAQPIDLLLSGLSGGVIGGAYFGQIAGARDLITLDMGGTSCDVGVVRGGRIGYATDYEIEWGLPVSTPVVDLTTIGAGGGSIAWIDRGGLLRVGPQSAGAEPGPACYARGGTEATVTDANLVLGRLDPDHFLGGKIPLDRGAADAALASLGGQLGLDVPRTAQAVIDIANENMVNAVRVLSINRGLDPREFSLVAFGGAGPLHAAAIAHSMRMRQVIIPLHPGHCSAFGALIADLQVNKVRSKHFRSDQVDAVSVRAHLDELVEQAVADLRKEGFEGQPEVERSISMRYAGQNYEQDVRVDDGELTEAALERVLRAFERLHEQFYGYAILGEVIELIRFNATVVGRTPKPALAELGPGRCPAPRSEHPVYFPETGFVATPVYDRALFPAGAVLEGPAVVEEPESTLLVHPGQHLSVDQHGVIMLSISN